MTGPIRFMRTFPYAILIGALIGFLLSPVSLSMRDAALGVYDNFRPVLTMHGALVTRQSGYVEIAISGEKNRACAYVNMQAYTEDDRGQVRDAYLLRVDRMETGQTKPAGLYDIGLWRVWPVDAARRVTIFAQHLCNGRLVLTKVAEVPLKPPKE